MTMLKALKPNSILLNKPLLVFTNLFVNLNEKTSLTVNDLLESFSQSKMGLIVSTAYQKHVQISRKYFWEVICWVFRLGKLIFRGSASFSFSSKCYSNISGLWLGTTLRVNQRWVCDSKTIKKCRTDSECWNKCIFQTKCPKITNKKDITSIAKP